MYRYYDLYFILVWKNKKHAGIKEMNYQRLTNCTARVKM